MFSLNEYSAQELTVTGFNSFKDRRHHRSTQVSLRFCLSCDCHAGLYPDLCAFLLHRAVHAEQTGTERKE